MRKLGEQWVEEIYGKKHMLKAVAPVDLCQGCCFNCNQGGCCWDGFDDCQMGSFFIIKDLGILNEDGLLPCPFCKEYPELVEESDENDEAIYTVEHECSVLIEAGWWHDRQQAIDAWNRRV